MTTTILLAIILLMMLFCILVLAGTAALLKRASDSMGKALAREEMAIREMGELRDRWSRALDMHRDRQDARMFEKGFNGTFHIDQGSAPDGER